VAGITIICSKFSQKEFRCDCPCLTPPTVDMASVAWDTDKMVGWPDQMA
jgi:hypothetical protein